MASISILDALGATQLMQVALNGGVNLALHALADTTGANILSISAGGAAKVDGSAVVQPVSGTFWQATQPVSGTFFQATQPVSGTITANAGTNLNTSLLALETGGNLATIAGAVVGQGTALGTIKNAMVAGSVTTNAPSYTTGQISPLSLDASGLLRVSLKDTPANTNNLNVNLAASAATVAVSGTFWQATQPVSIAATVSVSGTVTANAGTNLNTSSLALETGGNLATIAAAIVAQATALGSTKNALVAGSVTTNAPSYTTGQISPLSLDASGLLRCSLKDTPSNTNNFNVNLAASAATVTVSGTVSVSGSVTVAQATAASLNATVVGTGTFAVQAAQSGNWTSRVVGNAGATLDSVVGAGTAPTNQMVVGALYNSTEISPTTGQAFALQADSKGRLRGVIMDAAGNTRGANVNASNQLAVIDGSTSATGSAVPASATYVAGDAATSLPSAASAGNLTGAMYDKFGRAVSLISTIRDLVGTQTTTLSATTSETTIVTAAASVFNDLVMLIISNTSTATNTRIDFRDTTGGTVLFSLQSNGGQPPVGFVLPTPIPQTSVNTNWTAQCGTSTTDVRVYAVFAKNR